MTALGIASGIAMAGGEHVLLVPAEDSDRAAAELFKYTRENRPGVPLEEPQRPLDRSVGAAVTYAALLIALDLAARWEVFGLRFLPAGIADSALIRAGAWWRAVTALTLHADALHLAGNVAFGAVFGIMLGQSIGVGLAWMTFLVTGAAGNWLNAWIQAPAHASIGASTAIFGLLGAQSAHDWMRRRQTRFGVIRRWGPLVAGAVLLAWLGGNGRSIDAELARRIEGEIEVAAPRIDVWAHLLGFAVGLAAGALTGRLTPQLLKIERAQPVIAWAAAAAFALAWCVALR